jgi:hypothetical protein
MGFREGFSEKPRMAAAHGRDSPSRSVRRPPRTGHVQAIRGFCDPSVDFGEIDAGQPSPHVGNEHGDRGGSCWATSLLTSKEDGSPAYRIDSGNTQGQDLLGLRHLW